MRILSAIRFKASFNGVEILNALMGLGGDGAGKVIAVKLWETETINALGWSEERWVRLTYNERLRKICAHKLEGWLSNLEAHRQMAKMKAKNG